MKPKEITIMADYGSAYAWDDEGCSYDFEDFLDIEGMAAIVQELEEWQEWFETETFTSDPGFPLRDGQARNFPWDEFHAQGLELAKRIRSLIDPEIKLFYQKPVEDPNHQFEGKIEIR
jgi:hypothetical protein